MIKVLVSNHWEKSEKNGWIIEVDHIHNIVVMVNKDP